MGPRAKLGKVAESACPVEQIAQCAQSGAQRNLLKNSDPSLRSASPGIRSWAFFSDLSGRPHVTPKVEGVLGLPIFFVASRSYKIYVARLEKARLLLGVSTTTSGRIEGCRDFCPDSRSRVGLGGRSLA